MFSYPDYLTLPISACLAVTLDFMLGEPKHYHPLVGFGWLAQHVERYLNKKNALFSHQRLVGLFGLMLLVAPPVYIAFIFSQGRLLTFFTNTLLLYFAVGHKSLHEHAGAVEKALSHQDVDAAKQAASYMVSRDSAAIEPISATVESVLENGNDGVFGALFWFFIAGGIGVLAFRLINTMDAMWGYKTPRYYYFGWAAARLDDLVSYLPARLTAITYALIGNTRGALRCWFKQAPLWDSPNAGPVMSSGAGAMQVRLGGPACYEGEWHERPVLGEGNAPTQKHIEQALKLVRYGVYGWLGFALLVCIMVGAYFA